MITGANNANTIKSISTIHIGRPKKYVSRLPLDITTDCLKDLSAKGPNIIAKTTGAGWKPVFLIK